MSRQNAFPDDALQLVVTRDFHAAEIKLQVLQQRMLRAAVVEHQLQHLLAARFNGLERVQRNILLQAGGRHEQRAPIVDQEFDGATLGLILVEIDGKLFGDDAVGFFLPKIGIAHPLHAHGFLRVRLQHHLRRVDREILFGVLVRFIAVFVNLAGHNADLDRGRFIRVVLNQEKLVGARSGRIEFRPERREAERVRFVRGHHQKTQQKKRENGSHGGLLFGRNGESEGLLVRRGDGAGQRGILGIGDMNILPRAQGKAGRIRHHAAGRHGNAVIGDGEGMRVAADRIDELARVIGRVGGGDGDGITAGAVAVFGDGGDVAVGMPRRDVGNVARARFLLHRKIAENRNIAGDVDRPRRGGKTRGGEQHRRPADHKKIFHASPLRFSRLGGVYTRNTIKDRKIGGVTQVCGIKRESLSLWGEGWGEGVPAKFLTAEAQRTQRFPLLSRPRRRASG